MEILGLSIIGNKQKSTSQCKYFCCDVAKAFAYTRSDYITNAGTNAVALEQSI
jgi:hypothetical protein